MASKRSAGNVLEQSIVSPNHETRSASPANSKSMTIKGTKRARDEYDMPTDSDSDSDDLPIRTSISTTNVARGKVNRNGLSTKPARRISTRIQPRRQTTIRENRFDSDLPIERSAISRAGQDAAPMKSVPATPSIKTNTTEKSSVLLSTTVGRRVTRRQPASIVASEAEPHEDDAEYALQAKVPLLTGRLRRKKEQSLPPKSEDAEVFKSCKKAVGIRKRFPSFAKVDEEPKSLESSTDEPLPLKRRKKAPYLPSVHRQLEIGLKGNKNSRVTERTMATKSYTLSPKRSTRARDRPPSVVFANKNDLKEVDDESRRFEMDLPIEEEDANLRSIDDGRSNLASDEAEDNNYSDRSLPIGTVEDNDSEDVSLNEYTATFRRTDLVEKPTGNIFLGTASLEDPFTLRRNCSTASNVRSNKTSLASLQKSIKEVKSVPKKETQEPAVTDFAVSTLRSFILPKLMGRQRLSLVGLIDEYNLVLQLLLQTVTAGEGNSLLLVGPRASGKTSLIETALSKLDSEHADNYHIVRLNGFLQTDDRMAIREIWRQLGAEMSLDEADISKSTNFADNLARILAVLSHPDEVACSEPVVSGHEQVANLGEKLSTAVIFVLKEFDLFATHPRQTLLYNLFDIAQARKAPIAVIGITSKIDVVDSLEKRVKSRFSHRLVHMKYPSSMEAFWEVVKDGLTAEAKPEFLKGLGGKAKEVENYFDCWNRYIKEVLRNNQVFDRLLRGTYATSKDPRRIFNVFLSSLSALTSSSAFPIGDTFNALPIPTSTIILLPSLSDLELALLISAARLEVLADAESVAFEMVYDEYLAVCRKIKLQQTPGGSLGKVWGKQIASGAWENLQKFRLLLPVGNGRWRVDVSLMELRNNAGSSWARWCMEVI